MPLECTILSLNLLQKGFTPLHEAARNGHVRIVEILLKSYDSPDPEGKVSERLFLCIKTYNKVIRNQGLFSFVYNQGYLDVPGSKHSWAEKFWALVLRWCFLSMATPLADCSPFSFPFPLCYQSVRCLLSLLFVWGLADRLPASASLRSSLHLGAGC